MISFFRNIAICAAISAVVPGCSTDNGSTSSSAPYDPTPQMLNAGPAPGKEFLQWNATGRQIGGAWGYEVTGTCFRGQATQINIPGMMGLSVQSSSLSQDSLHCTLQIKDTTYTQTEYLPDGFTWADSVGYWTDSSVVALPDSVTPEDVTFYWYNRSDGTFVEVPTTYSNTQWYAKTLHFSRYILGQKRT